MSRIGLKPVPMPSGVTATIDGQQVTAKGPKGELSVVLVEQVLAEMTDAGIEVKPRDESKRARAMWGMSRTLVSNIVTGVSKGFSRNLEIVGIGFRAAVQGSNLHLNLGFSHDVTYPIPKGITIQCPRPTEIVISGTDRQTVGQVAAEIRSFRPPEPYKGKGVRYAGEYVFRKEGKKK
ncbi:MAG: 50S ribosomal protein L6 [Hyphomicrobiales bacterium]|nr:50S ribosomal protein L6 [Hyphomicrobiales bacterium]